MELELYCDTNTLNYLFTTDNYNDIYFHEKFGAITTINNSRFNQLVISSRSQFCYLKSLNFDPKQEYLDKKLDRLKKKIERIFEQPHNGVSTLCRAHKLQGKVIFITRLLKQTRFI